MVDPRDGGWVSRKLWYAVFTALLMLGSALVGRDSEGFRAMYGELTMGLTGLAALFFGANTFGKWTVAKNAKQLAEAAVAGDGKERPGLAEAG